MIRYVALLRGINVSGQKIIKMESLRLIFELIGFLNVKTYIQSGNVVFDSKDNDQKLLCLKIEEQLQKSLDYKVIVFLRSLPEIKKIIENNPFSSKISGQNTSLYVSFLSEEPNNELKTSLHSRNNDIEVFNILNREVYCLRLVKNDGKTKFLLYSIEKILGVPSTTRNWNTVNKLLSV